MTRMDDLLSAVFYRRSCPQPETLGDYHLGHLASGDRLVVALHLRECPHCTAELALYAGETSDSLADLLDVARNALANLVSRVAWAAPSAGQVLTPALRGAPYVPLRYQSAGVQIVLEVQPAISGYRRKRLLGKVEPFSGAIGADLWNETELLDSLAVGRDGYFAFDRLKPGKYFLCLRGNGAELWLDVNVEARA